MPINSSVIAVIGYLEVAEADSGNNLTNYVSKLLIPYDYSEKIYHQLPIVNPVKLWTKNNTIFNLSYNFGENIFEPVFSHCLVENIFLASISSSISSIQSNIYFKDFNSIEGFFSVGYIIKNYHESFQELPSNQEYFYHYAYRMFMDFLGSSDDRGYSAYCELASIKTFLFNKNNNFLIKKSKSQVDSEESIIPRELDKEDRELDKEDRELDKEDRELDKEDRELDKEDRELDKEDQILLPVLQKATNALERFANKALWNPEPAWNAVVYSRAYEHDHQYFCFPRSGSSYSETIVAYIKSIFKYPKKLVSNPRFIIVSDPNFCLVGLVGYVNQILDEDKKEYSYDSHDRDIIAFLGCVTADKLPVFPEMSIDNFKSLYDFVINKWDRKPEATIQPENERVNLKLQPFDMRGSENSILNFGNERVRIFQVSDENVLFNEACVAYFLGKKFSIMTGLTDQEEAPYLPFTNVTVKHSTYSSKYIDIMKM